VRSEYSRLISVTAERPHATAARPYRFPGFTRHKLDNGMELIVAPVRRLPLVSVRALVDAGASVERSHVAGVAALTARALAEGTSRLPGVALAESFERLGGSLSSYATWDGSHISATVLRERFGPALQLIAEVLREPAFAGHEIERLRGERIAELLELRAEPRGLADETFESFLYSSSSRFSLPEVGALVTVQELTRGNIVEFYGVRFRPTATTLIVVGDVDAEEVVREATVAFSGWSGVAPARPSVESAPARTDRAVQVVSRPDAPQTELRVGHVGVPRRHPDYFPLVVTNAVFGGVFNSRINLNLRERHGYTYGASSAFEWRREAGPFTISTAVATETTVPAIREIVLELENLRENSVTTDELSLALSYLEGVFPIHFETTEAIASALASLQTFGLSDDYFDAYRSRIREVSASDVERVSRAHLLPALLQVVAVGDPTKIEPELESLEFGPAHFLDPSVTFAEKP
jgi:zinc protease